MMPLEDQERYQPAVRRYAGHPTDDRLVCAHACSRGDGAIRAATSGCVAILWVAGVGTDDDSRRANLRHSRSARRIRVSALIPSRFKSHRPNSADVLKELAKGELDIVIGTHRLPPGDSSSSPGLLVIDEESSVFGVAPQGNAPEEDAFLRWMLSIVGDAGFRQTPEPAPA